MNINELEKMENEGAENLPSLERRTFLRAGLAITGLFMGGTILSLTTARTAGKVRVPRAGRGGKGGGRCWVTDRSLRPVSRARHSGSASGYQKV